MATFWEKGVWVWLSEGVWLRWYVSGLGKTNNEYGQEDRCGAGKEVE